MRVACLAMGCLSVMMLLAGLVGSTPVEAQGGRVFSVTGDWRFASQTGQVVIQGQPVSPSDTLIPPFDPRRSERIAMWFEEGRVACTAERSGNLECFGIQNTACAKVQNTGMAPVRVGIGDCLTDSDPRGPFSFLRSILHVFGDDPKRYIPLLSRSLGPAVEEAVLVAAQDPLPLSELIPGFPGGQYRICLARLQEVSDQPNELCDDVVWNGSEGSWPASTRSGNPWRFIPGLYELTVVGASGGSSAWVLLAHPDRFREVKEAFAETKESVGSWPGADRIEIRAALRAWLAHLDSS